MVRTATIFDHSVAGLFREPNTPRTYRSGRSNQRTRVATKARPVKPPGTLKLSALLAEVAWVRPGPDFARNPSLGSGLRRRTLHTGQTRKALPLRVRGPCSQLLSATARRAARDRSWLRGGCNHGTRLWIVTADDVTSAAGKVGGIDRVGTGHQIQRDIIASSPKLEILSRLAGTGATPGMQHSSARSP